MPGPSQQSLASLTASLASLIASLASLVASFASQTALAALRSSRSQFVSQPQPLLQPQSLQPQSLLQLLHPQPFPRWIPQEFPQELPPHRRSNNIIQQFISQYLHYLIYCIVFCPHELLPVPVRFFCTSSSLIQRKASSSPCSASIFNILSSTPLVYSCITWRFLPARKYS